MYNPQPEGYDPGLNTLDTGRQWKRVPPTELEWVLWVSISMFPPPKNGIQWTMYNWTLDRFLLITSMQRLISSNSTTYPSKLLVTAQRELWTISRTGDSMRSFIESNENSKLLWLHFLTDSFLKMIIKGLSGRKKRIYNSYVIRCVFHFYVSL